MTTDTSPVFAVVGATRGIGAATVAALAADPARRIVFCGRDRDAGAALAEKLGDTVDFVPADVTDPDAVAQFFAAVAERGRLVGAFNCAGVIGTDTVLRGNHFHEADPDQFDSVLAVNVTAVARCLRHELRLMVEHGAGGAVVNCSSVAGLRAADSLSVSYTAAKHAVVGMTRTLAVEYARHGIRLNAVCPGVIDTDMLGGLHDRLLTHLRAKNPAARIGTAAEVADAVEFLLSDRATYISGTTLTVDAGGLYGAL